MVKKTSLKNWRNFIATSVESEERMLNIKPFGERTPIILSPQLPLKAESICTFLGAMVNPISPWIVFGCFSNRIAAVSLQFWPVRKLKSELHHFACQTKENGYTYIYTIVYIRFSIYIYVYIILNARCTNEIYKCFSELIAQLPHSAEQSGSRRLSMDTTICNAYRSVECAL